MYNTLLLVPTLTLMLVHHVQHAPGSASANPDTNASIIGRELPVPRTDVTWLASEIVLYSHRVTWLASSKHVSYAQRGQKMELRVGAVL